MRKWNNPLQRSKRGNKGENAKLQITAKDIFSAGMEEIFHKVRPYIDFIDSLRCDGIDQDLPLPAIAVIGDQSSGKSSVLEALSGVALPRGSGIVTRCPLELKLRRQEGALPFQAIITYRDKTTEFTDPTLVEGYIKDAQNELAGDGVGISDELISLEIMSPEVCDLTLIDLPGIVRVPVKGQPEDIGDQVKRLINRFIQKTETIILVVVPCNVDIATTEALKMAQKVDFNHKRTLAILTKPDLVDRGTEKNILEIVDNKVIPLSKGYIVVKCRGQQQIQDRIPLAEAAKMEEEFFKQHQYFSCLYDEEKATISYLATKLTRELVEHIQSILPTLSVQINQELMESNNLLSLCPPTDPKERKHFLNEIISQLNDTIKRLSAGEIVDDVNLYGLLRKHFTYWREKLEESKTSYSKEVQNMLTKYDNKHRGRELCGVIDFKVFERLTRDSVMKQEEPALTMSKEIRKTLDNLLNGVLNNCFTNCPFLLKETKNKIGNIQSEQQAKVEDRIREQFKLEQLVYTDDKNLCAYVQGATTGEKGENTNSPSWWNPLVLLEKKSTGGMTKMMDNGIKLLFEAYYAIVIQRLADQIPMLIQHFLVKESAGLLIRGMQDLKEVVDLEKAFSEGSDSGQRRNKLERRIKRLGQAQEDLRRLL